MKKFLLLCAAVLATANSLWAYDATIALAAKSLVDGRHYYIYDAYGDNGKSGEADPSGECRYAFRYDSGEGIQGTHVKPRTVVSGESATSLENKHVWKAVKDGGNWKFQNVATKKWIGSDANTADTGTAVTLEATRNPREFKVVIPGTNQRWDGSEATNMPFTYWQGVGHPIHFYEANTNGGNFYLPGHNAWSVLFQYSNNATAVKIIPSGADVREYLPQEDFAVLTVRGNNYIVGENNRTFDVDVTEQLPFRASANLNTATWQVWYMHSTYSGKGERYSLRYTPNDNTSNVTAIQNEPTSVHPDDELWAFVGNIASGFKIYNKKAGTTRMLTKGDGLATLEEGQTDPAKTLWFPVVSQSNPDQTKFFTFRAYAGNNEAYTYLNLQWKDVVDGNAATGILKYWNAADQGSTAWVEGMSFPTMEALNVFDNVRPTIKGVVGDFVNEETASFAATTAQRAKALLDAIDPWQPIPPSKVTELTNLKNQINNLPRVKFDPVKSYRLYNCQYQGYLELNAEGNLVGGGSNASNSTLVSFAQGSAGNKYYMAINGRYFRSVNESEPVSTSTNSDEAGEFILSTIVHPFQYVFKGGDSMRSYLHEDRQHDIVGWHTSELPTLWYLVPLGVTDITEAVAPAAPQGIYDLQGRRVTNPTSGLYIINGFKVMVK